MSTIQNPKNIALAVVIASFSLQGCYTKYSYKNNELMPASEYSRDALYCLKQGTEYFPSAPQQITIENSKITGGTTSCVTHSKHYTTCAQSDLEIVPAKTKIVDANANSRGSMTLLCMDSLGWRDIWIRKGLPIPPNLIGVTIDGNHIRNLEDLGPHKPIRKIAESEARENNPYLGIGTRCNTGVDCTGDLICLQGQCKNVLLPIGSSCKTTFECAGENTSCINSVCRVR
ncbi:MAG: hypothetical protein H6R14_1516 [Proteobacteria bacterium]|nr:hypothetical protein [Pseudomonadota bacterium]